jgi:hypothetical protein
LIVIPDGGGSGRGLWFINLAPGSYPSGDVAPYVVAHYTTTNASFSATNFNACASPNNNGCGLGYYKKGLSGEAFVNYRGLGYGSAFTNGGAGINPYDGDDNFVPIPVGRLTSDAQGGWKGWIPIDVISWPLSTRVDGDYADVDTNGDAIADIRMVFFDDLAFRWPTGVIPVL